MRKLRTVKKLLQVIIYPLKFFTYKKFYLLMAADLIFLLFLIGLGSFLGDDPYNIGQAAMIAFGSIIAIGIVYVITRFFFYKAVGQRREYSKLWKYPFGLLFLILLNYVFLAVLYYLVNIIIVNDKNELMKKVVIGLVGFITYVLFLYFHKNYKKGFFKAIWNSYGNLFKIKSYKFLYHDAFIIIITYLIYNMVSLVFQFLTINLKGDNLIYNSYFLGISNGMMFIMIVAILTINKLVVYEVKPEILK